MTPLLPPIIDIRRYLLLDVIADGVAEQRLFLGEEGVDVEEVVRIGVGRREIGGQISYPQRRRI